MTMQLKIQSISDALPPALKAFSPAKPEFEKFKSNLEIYFSRIDSSESEENLKTHLMDLFKSNLSPSHVVEQQGTIDFVVRAGGKNSPAAVLVESKRAANKSDMIRKDDLNRKALHELVLYFMRERRDKNTDIQHLVICTEHEFFVFAASTFERIFYKNSKFRKDFEAWSAGKKSDSTTDFFYKEIAALFVAASDAEITATHVDLKEYQDQDQDKGDIKDNEIVKLFKLLGPQFLLKRDLANDSNSLNKSFYDELLHIIGLEERKDGSKRVIDRLEAKKRNAGSLLENTIEQVRLENKFQSQEMRLLYGNSNHEREFNIALELCLTWINRLLFLKLLEAQIFNFHAQDDSYKFLSTNLVADFNDLSDLFFKVLAFDPSERSANIQGKYGKIPYLNSSLFELTELEQIFRITLLNNGYELPIFKKTVLKDGSGSKVEGKKNTLAYVFDFLDTYDFGAVSGEDIREDSKTIINAAVLGLIFEKMNGYKEGAIFTPGYVTMFMARNVIEKTVLEAFGKKNPDWKLADLDDLRNNITDRSKVSVLNLNAVIDDLKICDPAVGSGHFLVSILNELIALKSRLGILADSEGKVLSEYIVEVDNDELIIVNSNTDEVFAYQVQENGIPTTIQHVQQTLFHEKQKLIENCLFGVDINANSVRICQLRLWIELLKSAYYRDGKDDQLETLPNIDINIKCGNSLLSRFRLDQNLSDAFNKAGLTVGQYRKLVSDYKNSKDKLVKHDLQQQIAKAKTRFQEESLGRITKEMDAAIAQLKADEAQADLFVPGEEQESKQTAKIADIHAKISMMEARREKLLQNKTFLSSLEWRFEFPEVLDDNAKFIGFDIIIANPPYMRIQKIEETQPLQKEFYEREYRTAHGSYDLANLFFELAVKLSKDHGNNIFIFPHKLFNSANGEPLREYLMNTRAIKHLTHFGANQVFESAITYTCIALFNSIPAESFRFKRFALGDDFERELGNETQYEDLKHSDLATASSLYGSNQWIFFDDPTGYSIFKKCFEQKSSVASKFEDVFQGIATSKDSLYVSKLIEETDKHYKILVNPENKNEEPAVEKREVWVEKDFFRPFLMGKDVHRFDNLKTDRLVFIPYFVDVSARLVTSDLLKEKYPKTWDYVSDYAKVFQAREGGKARSLAEWYAYIYPKNLSKFAQPKLTSMEICSRRPNVTLNPNSIYHATTVYSLVKSGDAKETYEFYAALLNSNVFWWFLKHTGDTLQGDARRMKTNYINPFPLPDSISKEKDAKIAVLVKALVHEKANSNSVEKVETLEKEINAEIYAIYCLSSAEIEIIERAI